MAFLSDRNINIIGKRLDGVSYSQIARDTQRSPERIRQIFFKFLRLFRGSYRRLGLCSNALGRDEIPDRKLFLAWIEAINSPKQPPDLTNMSHIEMLGFSTRTTNALLRSNICNLGELLEKDGEDLMNCRNLGRASLKEIRAKFPRITTH